MALLKVNTGLREREVVNLRWAWEQRVPDLNTSVLVIPAKFGGRRANAGVKNREDRLVVLNATTKAVIEACRGAHPEYVFVSRNKPVKFMSNTAWQRATGAPERMNPGTDGKSFPSPGGLDSTHNNQSHHLLLLVASPWNPVSARALLGVPSFIHCLIGNEC